MAVSSVCPIFCLWFSFRDIGSQIFCYLAVKIDLFCSYHFFPSTYSKAMTCICLFDLEIIFFFCWQSQKRLCLFCLVFFGLCNLSVACALNVPNFPDFQPSLSHYRLICISIMSSLAMSPLQKAKRPPKESVASLFCIQFSHFFPTIMIVSSLNRVHQNSYLLVIFHPHGCHVVFFDLFVFYAGVEVHLSQFCVATSFAGSYVLGTSSFFSLWVAERRRLLFSLQYWGWSMEVSHTSCSTCVYSFRMPLVCAGCRDRCVNISHAEVAVKSIGGITCHSFTIQCVACVAKVYSALPTPLHA